MEEIRNIGLLAHVDAGKTTLTEQLLAAAGAIRRAGNVDAGTSQTDWREVEKRRGISVKAACARLAHGGGIINLIDTPGHVDFAGEVERSLAALDGAVLVLSAVEGVQAQTVLLWEALRALRIPALVVINKLDRAGSDAAGVLEQAGRELDGLRPLLLHRAQEEGTDGCTVLPRTLEEPAFREELLLAAAESDPEMEEKFLAEEPIGEAALWEAVQAAARRGGLTPVLLASAKLGQGIEALLDGIVRFLPPAGRDTDAPLSGVVFALDHDPVMGKGAYVRLFGGQLRNREDAPLCGQEEAEKVTQIRRVSGPHFADTGALAAGDIGVLYGLSSARTGDVLGKAARGRSARLAVPLLQVQAFPEKEEELPALMEALGELTEEDPLLDSAWNPEKRELYLHITGKIQLEILGETLRERYGLAVLFSAPSIIYKETPAKAGEGFESYTMPKPCWAVVRLAMEPLPRGSGVTVESAVKEGELPRRYQNHVLTSVRETLRQGLYGWEVTDAKVTLIGGQHHHVHTHPLDFFVATPIAVLRALTDCGSTLLEPLVRVRMSGPEEALGRVLGDVLAMRGSFDSPVIRFGGFTLDAVLPVRDSLDYPAAFRSLTSGKGAYSSRFCGYRECPLELGAVTPRRGVDPLDRAKWILYARSALQ